MRHDRTTSRALHLFLFASLAFLGGADGDCGDPILENNGFDLWCEEQLCYWEVEEGDVARVPTWHRSDHGVELLGDAAAISQLSEIESSTACLRFEAVANVEESASASVEVDFFDDGTVDFTERIPTSSWEPVSFLVTPPEHYRGARFRIRKVGAGAAQLATLVVEEADKCVEPPLEVDDRGPGALCTEDEQCASGLCRDQNFFGSGACATCAGDGDCGQEEVCGLIEPDSPVQQPYRGCRPAGSRNLGAACALDAECASGLCARPGLGTGVTPLGAPGVCSTCSADEDCGDGDCRAILAEDPDASTWVGGPLMCAPFAGAYASGEPCVLDESCASGACSGSGALEVCAGSQDGRLCEEDDDCYRDDPCVAIGTLRGTCR